MFVSYFSNDIFHILIFNAQLINNRLFEPLQSAYKPKHSSETGLIAFFNEILSKLKQDAAVLLDLLDMYAAFDTVNHTIMLKRFWSSRLESLMLHSDGFGQSYG